MARRIERVNHLIRQEISELLQREIKDPRLNGLISVTEVIVSPDLRYARVLVSKLGGESEKQEILKALTASAGFLHRELTKRLSLRHIPELQFEWDDSIERGARILELIDKTSRESAGGG